MRQPAWIQDWLAWCLGGLLLLSLLSALNVALQVGSPYGGFLEEDAPAQQPYRRASAYTPAWWPNLAMFNLRGHSLISLNGQPYRPAAQQLFAAAWAGGARTVTLVSESPAGQRVTTPLPVRLFSWSDYLDVKLPAAITGLSWWLLAALLYQTRPRAGLNRVAAWTFALVSATTWAGWFSIFIGPLPERLLNMAFNGWLWPLTGAALVHLSLSFPRPSRLLRRPVLWSVYAWAGLAGGLHNAATLLDTLSGWSPLTARLDDLASLLGSRGLFLVGLAMVVGRLVLLALTERRDPAVRGQVGVVLLGLACASPFLVLLILQLLRLGASFFWEGLDTRYLLLAVPLAFALAILRYKSFRTFHPIFAVVAVLAGSALLASIGAWGVSRIQGQAALPLSQAFVPIFGVTLVASIFWSTQTSWQGWLSRLFHWERSSFASARIFGQRLVGLTDPAALSAEMAHQLVRTLGVERAAVWLWNPATVCLELAGQAGQWPVPPPAAWRWEAEILAPLHVTPEPAAGEAALLPARAAGLAVLAPLNIPAGRLGVLGLGKHADEEIFDERDLEIIDLVAQQAALLLVAARQVAELRRVPAQLAEAQKRERLRMAQDLHDMVQQRLGGLQPLLETVRLLQANHPARAAGLLERAMNEVEILAQMVSRLRLDLAPPELARGLTVALERLAERYRQRAGLEVHLHLPPDLDERLPAGAGHELFLVVGQALDNVVEHARAKHVHLEFAFQPGRLEFAVSDDGVGFNPRAAPGQTQDHFGLVSMEARLASLAGALAITSAPGAGTRLAGWVPLA